VVLATMGRPLSPDQRRQIRPLRNVQLHESSFRLCWMPEPWEDVEKSGAWLLALERETAPDVVHLNDLAHGGLDWLSPVLLVAHSCVLSWWEAVRHQAAPSPEWDRYRDVVHNSIMSSNLVAAPTAAMLSAIIRHYAEPENTAVIPNGRNFPRMLMSAEEKRRHAQPLIFSAGRLWDEAKNIAALELIADELHWSLAIAGERRDPGTGNVGAPQDEPSSNVEYLGHLGQEAIAPWLQRASIYAAPARYEPFGLAVLEAARTRCALVLGDIPSLREVWGGAAEYISPERPEQLADVLNALSQDPEKIERMGNQAAQRAQRYFSSHMAARYVDCYRSLLGVPDRPPLSNLQRSGTRL
jgi:glycogen(starch) synthase